MDVKGKRADNTPIQRGLSGKGEGVNGRESGNERERVKSEAAAKG